MNYWNKIYSKNKQLSIWPWSDVVSLCNIFCKKEINNSKRKVLELGFGAGANIPFFLNKKIQYYGIEGSHVIARKVKRKFKKIKSNLIVADFKNEFFKDVKFDLILDRASITHNNKPDIKKIIQKIKKHLNKNAYFIGIDWYSKNCTEYKEKKSKKDYLYLKKGSFKNLGGVFFSSINDMKYFFKDFKILHLSEKKIEIYKNSKVKTFSSWSIVVKKK